MVRDKHSVSKQAVAFGKCFKLTEETARLRLRAEALETEYRRAKAALRKLSARLAEAKAEVARAERRAEAAWADYYVYPR